MFCEFPEATLSRPHLIRFIPPYRFLSPYISHHVSGWNACNFTLYMGNSDSMRRHPVTSIKKGESIIRAFNLPLVVRNNMVDQIGEESLALGLLKLKRLQNCWSVVVMVAASTNKEVDAHIPNYPNLPPQLICQLHNITMHADVETDEVYAQMMLQPLSQQEQKDMYLLPAELGTFSKQPSNYFCKTLTASDTNTHGGFCGDLN